MKKLPVLLIACLVFFSCGKLENAVPSVPVNITINKANPQVLALSSPGGVAFLSGGVAGIVLYRSTDGRYLAYDRCSSYLPQNLCAVVLDDSGFTLLDPCSGSKFSLSDGGPVKAPATRSLRMYNVSDSQFEINVYN